MACNKPFKAYQSIDGGLTRNPAKSKNGILNNYPCNQCLGCKKSNTGHWTSRLAHESDEHENAIFLTLTYSEETIPIDGSLNPRHVELFMKRLRDKISPEKIRFYQGAEYGTPKEHEFEKFGRPHYHLLIFGWEPDDKELISTAGGHFLSTSKLLEDTWGKGHCPFGDVTPQSCMYVAQYTQKKVYGKSIAPDHYTVTDPYTGQVIELQPEYSTMSRKPGIGLNYFNRWFDDFFPSDFYVRKGQKIAVPKYYLDKLEEINPDMYEDIKERRKAAMKNNRKDRTQARLDVKEKILQITINKKQREQIL